MESIYKKLWISEKNNYDIIVIGAGHAGIEASCIASKLEKRVCSQAWRTRRSVMVMCILAASYFVAEL